MPKTFSLARSISLALGTRVVRGENIPFDASDVQIVFPTWETLTPAQQMAITTEMASRGLEAVD